MIDCHDFIICYSENQFTDKENSFTFIQKGNYIIDKINYGGISFIPLSQSKCLVLKSDKKYFELISFNSLSSKYK